MAKDRKKLQHMHSSIPDKQPTPASLEVGEIAVNNAAEQEFLSIKNTNNKVVRFSSDGQIIEWIERKEVMPYVGYVRGAAGPSATSGDTPTADGYGSYGIENTDLLNNKSELVFKLNQVAADLTTKHDKVNGKKDMYNKDVNPTTDGGINDGAGFFIDMSRYAMQDANPQFSSTTNTCRTTLSGTTIIRGLDGSCGSLLDIKVNSATTEVKTATTKVTSANTNISTATTVIGTADTKVNSAYTSANTATTIIKTANTSATTAILSGNTLTVNENQTTVNSCGKVEINTDSFSLSQCSNSGGSAEFEFCNGYTVKSNDVKIQHCDGATSSSISIKEKTIEISGTTINEGGTTNNNTFTTVNNTATTINNSTTTYNITGTSNTNVYGGDVCISGGTEASLGAKTVKIGTDCGTNTIASGITINATSSVTVNTPTTIITGDTYISGDTTIGDNLIVSGDTTVDGKLIINIPCDSIKSQNVNEALCEIMRKGVVTMTRESDPEDIRLAAVYKLFQNGEQIGYDINVPKDGFLKSVELVPVENVFYLRFTWYVYDADTKTYTTASTDVNVEDLVKDIEANNAQNANRGATVNVWYNTTTKKMNVSADTVINLAAAANASYERKNGQHYLSASTLTFSGGTFSSGTYNAFGNGKTINIPTSTKDIKNELDKLSITIGGTAETTEQNYNGSTPVSITIPKSMTDITERGKLTVKHNNETSAYTPGDTSTFTFGHSSLTLTYGSSSGKTGDVTYNTSTATSVTIPTDVAHLQHKTLNIITDSGNTLYDPAGSGTVDINLKQAAKEKLTIKYEATSDKSGTVEYDTTTTTAISIPTCVSHLNRHKITFQSGSTSTFNSKTYDPGSDCSNTAETINIPSKISNLTNDLSGLTIETGNTYVSGSPYNGSSTAKIVVPASVDNLTNYTSYSDGAIHLPHNVVVTGRVEASNGFFQTSDERKKDNIKNIEFNDFNKVKNVMPKSFTFKDDETHRKVYGAIAQEIEGVGLDELVYTDQNGYKSVDYTSLLMLKIAYLESYCDTLNLRITELENKINNNN